MAKSKSSTTKKVVRKKKGGLTDTALSSWVSQFVGVKEQQRQIKARYEKIRGRLAAAIEEHGYYDSDGHQWLDVEGVDGIPHIKREKRESVRIDEDEFFALVEKKGLGRKRFVRTIEVLDEDAVYAALYEKDPKNPTKSLITEKELESVIKRSTSWAVKEVTE